MSGQDKNKFMGEIQDKDAVDAKKPDAIILLRKKNFTRVIPYKIEK